MLTLDQLGVRIFMRAAASASNAAAELRAMYDRRKPSEAREALWDGWWIVKQEAENCVAELTKRGGLLHFGSAAALAWVNETERRHA